MIEKQEIEVEKVIKVKEIKYVITMTEDELITFGYLVGNVLGQHYRRKEHCDKWHDSINKFLKNKNLCLSGHIEFDISKQY